MKYKHLILGGTGHIGSELAELLIAQGEPVLIIGHDPEKAADWLKKGAAYEVADIMNTQRLHELFEQGECLFVLNPPAPISTDTVAEETKSVDAILTALNNTHLKKIVAASTYGAQSGDDIGDLGVLYHLEQGLAALHQTPVAVIRSAYYMSNWDTVAGIVQNEGILPTLYPADFKLPMVAPADISAFAAALMLNEVIGLHYIEGPERYSARDVAAVFSHALNKQVEVSSTPDDELQDSLIKAGFSKQAAQYMSNVTKIALHGDYKATDPHHGQTTLQDYIISSLKLKVSAPE